MGRSFTAPAVVPRKSLGDNVVGYVIGRVRDPDDEFAEHQVLCRDESEAYGFHWLPTGSSYDGNAVEFRPDRLYDAHQAVALLLFGRDSVSVSFEL